VIDGISATGMPDGKYTHSALRIDASAAASAGMPSNTGGAAHVYLIARWRNIERWAHLCRRRANADAESGFLLGIEFRKVTGRVGADADILLRR